MSRQVGALLTALVAVSALLLGGGSAAAVVPAQPGSTTVLAAGEQLAAGDRLSSPNGQFHLAVQPDGNTVLYVTATNRPLWATNTYGPVADRLMMQTDGNLVLYGVDDAPLWASNTVGESDARLAVEDDGGLVLTSSAGRHVLQAPGSELATGESLVAGQSLVSPDGRFSLVLQADGNLVEIEAGAGPVWATGTSGDTQLALDPTGDLVVRATDDDGVETTSWSTRADVPGTRLVVQDDGNVVLYAGDVPVWSRGEDERRRTVAAAAETAAAAHPSPGDDYPNKDATPCGSGVYCTLGSQYSARGFAYRNCTDFVAWKIGMTWSQIADGRNGHAVGWKQGWIERGRSVGTTPQIGAVAWWSRGSYGHVAYVVAVNDDGSAVVEQYNAGGSGEFSTQTVRAEAYLY